MMDANELRAARLRALCCPDGCLWQRTDETCVPAGAFDDDHAVAAMRAEDAALDAAGYEIRPKLGEDQVIVSKLWADPNALFSEIAHGDEAHRAWLKAKLIEWFAAPKAPHE